MVEPEPNEIETIIKTVGRSFCLMGEPTNKECIVLLGPTKAGKSTLACYLAGIQLEPDNFKIAYVRKENDNICSELKISDLPVSITTIPNKVLDREKKNIIVDLPGLFDKSLAQEFLNSYFIFRIFQVHKKIKLLFVIRFDSLKGLGKEFTDCIEHLSKMFKDHNRFLNSISFVVSDVQNIITEETIQKLARNIVKENKNFYDIDARFEIVEGLLQNIILFPQPTMWDINTDDSVYLDITRNNQLYFKPEEEELKLVISNNCRDMYASKLFDVCEQIFDKKLKEFANKLSEIIEEIEKYYYNDFKISKVHETVKNRMKIFEINQENDIDEFENDNNTEKGITQIFNHYKEVIILYTFEEIIPLIEKIKLIKEKTSLIELIDFELINVLNYFETICKVEDFEIIHKFCSELKETFTKMEFVDKACDDSTYLKDNNIIIKYPSYFEDIVSKIKKVQMTFLNIEPFRLKSRGYLKEALLAYKYFEKIFNKDYSEMIYKTNFDLANKHLSSNNFERAYNNYTATYDKIIEIQNHNITITTSLDEISKYSNNCILGIYNSLKSKPDLIENLRKKSNFNSYFLEVYELSNNEYVGKVNQIIKCISDFKSDETKNGNLQFLENVVEIHSIILNIQNLANNFNSVNKFKENISKILNIIGENIINEDFIYLHDYTKKIFEMKMNNTEPNNKKLNEWVLLFKSEKESLDDKIFELIKNFNFNKLQTNELLRFVELTKINNIKIANEIVLDQHLDIKEIRFNCFKLIGLHYFEKKLYDDSFNYYNEALNIHFDNEESLNKLDENHFKMPYTDFSLINEQSKKILAEKNYYELRRILKHNFSIPINDFFQGKNSSMFKYFYIDDFKDKKKVFTNTVVYVTDLFMVVELLQKMVSEKSVNNIEKIQKIFDGKIGEFQVKKEEHSFAPIHTEKKFHENYNTINNPISNILCREEFEDDTSELCYNVIKDHYEYLSKLEANKGEYTDRIFEIIETIDWIFDSNQTNQRKKVALEYISKDHAKEKYFLRGLSCLEYYIEIGNLNFYHYFILKFTSLLSEIPPNSVDPGNFDHLTSFYNDTLKNLDVVKIFEEFQEKDFGKIKGVYAAKGRAYLNQGKFDLALKFLELGDDHLSIKKTVDLLKDTKTIKNKEEFFKKVGDYFSLRACNDIALDFYYLALDFPLEKTLTSEEEDFNSEVEECIKNIDSDDLRKKIKEKNQHRSIYRLESIHLCFKDYKLELLNSEGSDINSPSPDVQMRNGEEVSMNIPRTNTSKSQMIFSKKPGIIEDMNTPKK